MQELKWLTGVPMLGLQDFRRVNENCEGDTSN